MESSFIIFGLIGGAGSTESSLGFDGDELFLRLTEVGDVLAYGFPGDGVKFGVPAGGA